MRIGALAACALVLWGYCCEREALAQVAGDQTPQIGWEFFFFKQKTAYELGLGIPAEPLFRSCVTIFVILVVWFLLPRVARLMIHTPTAISIFVCLSMVQLMAVFISMRCTLCGHFLQVALTLILVVGYAIAAS